MPAPARSSFTELRPSGWNALLKRVEAYADRHGLHYEEAVHHLIDAGLTAEEQAMARYERELKASTKEATAS